MAEEEVAAAAAVDQNHDDTLLDTTTTTTTSSSSNSLQANTNSNIGIKQVELSNQQLRHTLETSAFTGKFWLHWDELKTILSYYLNQVLSEYPEALMSTDHQTASLGETFPDLVNRLNNALHTFVEGPPFTLQRLCEILLSAKTIYPKLSKLSLALEKNLLVTSTLSISTDPTPLSSKENTNGSCEEAEPKTIPLENGVESVVEAEAEATAAGDRDEIMTEVEEAEADEEMTTLDMETIESVVRSSEANPAPTVES